MTSDPSSLFWNRLLFFWVDKRSITMNSKHDPKSSSSKGKRGPPPTKSLWTSEYEEDQGTGEEQPPVADAEEQEDDDDDDNGNPDDEYGEEYCCYEDDSHLFPTHAAFTIPVEIKLTPRLGPNQYGVFAAQDIPAHTEFWLWTHRVVEIPASQIHAHIAEHYPPTMRLESSSSSAAAAADLDSDDENGRSQRLEAIRSFLRRGFVLPPPYDDCFYSNPTDAGTFMNHSTTPNCARPHGTTRVIQAGEELTMDYSGNGNPAWYVDLCHQYGILTPVEIAQEERQRGGVVQPADYDGPVNNALLDSMVSLTGL